MQRRNRQCRLDLYFGIMHTEAAGKQLAIDQYRVRDSEDTRVVILLLITQPQPSSKTLKRPIKMR